MKNQNAAELIFLNALDVMKSVLDLAEYRLGSDKKAYDYFKRKTMDEFYGGLKKVFAALEKDGKLARCKCESNLRHGYTNCAECHGAGYVNAFEKK